MSNANQPEVRAYLQSLKDPKKEYEILSYDEKTQTATLKGAFGHFPMSPFTKDEITKKGYKMVKRAAAES